MVRFALFAICATLLGVTTFDAAAGPQDRSVLPQGSYQEAREWNDIVCCKRGGEASFTTFGQCSHHHQGVIVNNTQCRHDANTNSETRWRDSDDNDANNRVCCQRGGSVWWSTARECRARGGDLASARRCSKS